jgi:hypothetical protein
MKLDLTKEQVAEIHKKMEERIAELAQKSKSGVGMVE